MDMGASPLLPEKRWPRAVLVGAARALLTSAPHPRQNLVSSAFCKPHFGQNIMIHFLNLYVSLAVKVPFCMVRSELHNALETPRHHCAERKGVSQATFPPGHRPSLPASCSGGRRSSAGTHERMRPVRKIPQDKPFRSLRLSLFSGNAVP